MIRPANLPEKQSQRSAKMRELTRTSANAIQIGAGQRTMAMKIFPALVFASLIPMPVAAQDPAGGPDPAQNQDVQVLTRGPVHEAFALPVVNDPKPGLTVAKQPPAPVEEAPPDQKPAGQNVQWISGYWSWDASRDDFLWVSGVWREPPPGRQWVPGYWHQVEGGYQWVAGALGSCTPGRERTPGAGPTPRLNRRMSPRRRLASRPGRTAPPPPPTSSGRREAGTGKTHGTSGGPASGRPFNRAGSGFLLTTSGRRAGILFVEGYWDLPLASRGILFAPVYYAAAGLSSASLCLYPLDHHRQLGTDRQPLRAARLQPLRFRRLL